MLNFRPGSEPALPAHARIDGIDRDFLFGNARSHGGCIPSPSRFGTLQASGALALAHSNYPVMCLGSKTNFWSPGISLDAFTPWVGCKSPCP